MNKILYFIVIILLTYPSYIAGVRQLKDYKSPNSYLQSSNMIKNLLLVRPHSRHYELPSKNIAQQIVQATIITIKKVKEVDEGPTIEGSQTIIQEALNNGNNNTVLQGIASQGPKQEGIQQNIIQAATNQGSGGTIGQAVDISSPE